MAGARGRWALSPTSAIESGAVRRPGGTSLPRRDGPAYLRRDLKRSLLGLSLVALVSCGGSSPDTPPVAASPAARFDACKADEVPVFGGGCAAIGVPADGCAEGFVHDGAGGCAPVLPEAVCPKGQLAVPGETACRAPSPCGEGPFGSIPVDERTLFVDGSVATTGDGTRDRPFKTIDEALGRATLGRPTIAVAAGVYSDAVIDVNVRLIGRCASMVEIRGTDKLYAAVEVHGDAEVSGVAVTGPGPGVVLGNDGKLTLADAWVHDVGKFGVSVAGQGEKGESPLLVSNVLVEGTGEEGFFAFGGAMVITRSVARDTGGIGARAELYTKVTPMAPGTLELRASVVERCQEAGVGSLASKVAVLGSVIRDTRPRAKDLRGGMGVYASAYPPTGARGELNVTQSWLSKNLRAGAYYDNAFGRLDRVVVRDTLGLASDGRFGDGAQILYGSKVDVTDSLFTDNRYTGLSYAASQGSITRTIVRDTQPSQGGQHGFGIAAWNVDAATSEVAVRRSLVAGAHDAAIAAGGSTLVIEDSALLGTRPRPDGSFGDGLTLTAMMGSTVPAELLPASAKVARTLFANNQRAGALLVGAKLELSDSALTCNGLDLAGSSEIGTTGAGLPVSGPWDLAPAGLVTCGCGAAAECRAQSTALTPTDAPVYER